MVLEYAMSDALLTMYGSSPLMPTGTAVAYATFVINGTTDAIEWIFQAKEDATVTKLGYNIASVGGTPSNLRISIQTVATATGRASGTLLGATNSAKFDFTSAAGWTWATLDESATVTRGAYYAIKIDYTSGATAPSGTNTTTFNYGYNHAQLWALPYTTTVDAGAATKQSASLPCFGYASSTKAYGYPSSAYTGLNVDSGTTPDEVGIAFTVPYDWNCTFRVIGVRVVMLTPATGRTGVLALYSGTTVLQNFTYYSDVMQAAGSTRAVDIFFDESTLSVLSSGVQYRVAIAPTDASADVTLRYITVSANSDLSAWPGGADYYYTQRTDAGAWADTTTKRTLIELILDQIDMSGKPPRIQQIVGGTTPEY